MRIYNLDADARINKVVIYLTPNEEREITIYVYDENNLSSFDERSKNLS